MADGAGRLLNEHRWLAPNGVGPKSTPLAAAETILISAQQAGTDCSGRIPPGATALSLNVTALNATSNSSSRSGPRDAEDDPDAVLVSIYDATPDFANAPFMLTVTCP